MGIENPSLNNCENTERLKYHYFFTNNDISDRPVIFECDADNPEQAFGLFKKNYGKQPYDEDHIGLSVVEN